MKFCLSVFFVLTFFSAQSQTLVKQSQAFAMDMPAVIVFDKGQKILTGSYDMKMYVLNAATGQTEKEIVEHKGFVLALAYCEKLNLIASAGWDQRIILWDATTMTKKLDIAAHTDRINALSFSPDGMRLASASDDKTVIVWDAMTGGEIFKLTDHTDAVTTVAFSADGTLIASAGWDKTITIHSGSTGKLLNTYKGHRGPVNSVGFSFKGDMMVSGSDDNSIIVWRTDSVKTLAKFDYFIQPVSRVSFFPGDKYIFCADGSGMLKVYNFQNKSMLEQKQIHEGAVKDMYINPTLGFMVTSGSDKIVKWWNVNEYLYFDCLKDKTKALQDLNKPKGEFETTEQYEKRLKEYDRQKSMMVNECVKEAEARQKAEQEAAEKAILSTYKYVFFPVTSMGTYDADKQEYPFNFNNQGGIVKLPIEDAKSLKENMAKAKVKAISRVVNGNTEVFNTELIHPVTGKAYPFGRQINATEDKLLGKFLQGIK